MGGYPFIVRRIDSPIYELLPSWEEILGEVARSKCTGETHEPEVGICEEHGGDPSSIELCHIGTRLRLLQPLQSAPREARGCACRVGEQRRLR
jgi:hypothetical protein